MSKTEHTTSQRAITIVKTVSPLFVAFFLAYFSVWQVVCCLPDANACFLEFAQPENEQISMHTRTYYTECSVQISIPIYVLSFQAILQYLYLATQEK